MQKPREVGLPGAFEQREVGEPTSLKRRVSRAQAQQARPISGAGCAGGLRWCAWDEWAIRWRVDDDQYATPADDRWQANVGTIQRECFCTPRLPGLRRPDRLDDQQARSDLRNPGRKLSISRRRGRGLILVERETVAEREEKPPPSRAPILAWACSLASALDQLPGAPCITRGAQASPRGSTLSCDPTCRTQAS